MKRRALFFLMMLLLWSAPVFGATYWTLVLDNEPVAAELPPVPVGNNALLVSAPALCHALKAKYEYDAPSGRIRVSSDTTVIDMNESVAQALVNGTPVPMPVAARRESGVLMLPVPFVAQQLGCTAQWNAESKTLTLISRTAMPQQSAASYSVPTPPPQGPPLVSVMPYLVNGNLPPSTSMQMPATPPISGYPPAYGMQLPQSPVGTNGVSLPQNAIYPSMQVPPNEQHINPPVPQAPFNTDFISKAGSMDFIPAERDPVLDLEDDRDIKEPQPDPAVTGLIIQRRYDAFVDAYIVRYRVTNLGTAPTDRPMLVRLLVGGGGLSALHVVADYPVNRLDPNQSLEFEWTGDAHSYPMLYDLTVKAQARIVLDQNAKDLDTRNNVRNVHISY